MGGTPTDWFSTAETTAEGGEPTIADDDTASTTELPAFRAATAPVVPPPLEPGSYVGRYRLEQKLGEGGMGQVWRARDPQLDRAVAIKVMHPAIARGTDGAVRLLREARAMAKLSHRNVVAVFDAGDDHGQLFVAMELVDGLTLGDLRRGRDVERGSWRRALALYAEAGRGLAAAHSAGVLHRDFKPDNVLVDRSGRVCVGDFGLAAFGAARERRALPGASVSALTATGTVIGTPAFMSPEQLRGDAVDARSDQFGFCVALYEALYGEHPFAADTAPSIAVLLDRIERGAIAAAPRPDPVPRWLRAAVVRGLSADPAARWPDVPALLAELDRRTSRVPWMLVGATAAAVIAAVLAVIVVVRARSTASERPPPAAVRLVDVSMATRIALSPDGRHLAMATNERLDVRELATGKVWTYLDPDSHLDRVQFDGPDRVLFGRPQPTRLAAYQLGGGVTAIWSDPAWATWLGRLTAGDVVARQVGSGWELGLIEASGTRTLGTLEGRAQVVSVAPGGERLALLEEGRYDGRVVVVDRTGIALRSEPLPALTAAGWIAPDRLALASGTVDRPTIAVVMVEGDRLGPPRTIYTAERGWFGQIVSGGGRLLFIDSGANFRSRLLMRGPGERDARDLDTGTVGAVLGWLDDGTILAWNRTSRAIERHDGRAVLAETPARLDGEAANATRAGDIVIASLRRDLGRELVAVSIADGRERWHQPAGHARAVRCAGDRQRPCFVFGGDGPEQQIRPIDPETGAEGEPLGPPGAIDDLAVSDDGTRLLISDGSSALQLLDLATGTSTTIDATITGRGLAFDPRGGFLVAGTFGTNQYQVVRIDGETREPLLRARNEILFMPRPSPDRQSVLVMGRLFLPAVFELPMR